MLTTVHLGGVLGRKFGKKWELMVSSPSEALRMIEANKPGIKSWIIQNVEKYSTYRVTCEYENGMIEDLGDKTYQLNGKIKSIKFTPIVHGAGGGGGVLQIVVGAVLVVAGIVCLFVPGMQGFAPYLFAAGAGMILGGVVQMLSPRPKTVTASQNQSDAGTSSNYFDGPMNTEGQGSPVPVIYGRMLVGSHPISASISIDEVAV